MGPWAVGAALPAALGSIPWGALVVAAVAIALLYLGFRRFRRWAVRGGEQLAPATVGPAPPPSGAVPAGSGPETPSAPVAAGPGAAVIWRPETGGVPLPDYSGPKSVSQRPPPRPGFSWRVVVVFAAVALALALLHRVVFLAIDTFVRYLGALVFWPHPWPGVLLHPTLQRTLPDFVLLMYLAMILSIAFSARVFTDPRYEPRQRWNAVMLIVGYFFAEGLVDAFAFAVPERFLASAFLLVRALLGGTVLALLLFGILSLPNPVAVVRRVARDRWAVVLTALTAALSLLLAVGVLVVLYREAGFGRTVIPFAVLLLLPFLGLTFFGLIGRVLYAAELRQRPVPPVTAFAPTVSVIIPAYNEEATVAAAIHSADAAAALYPGTTEIIVANDGSRDGTSGAARAAIAELAHARGAVLDLPHGGKSNALNAALSAAQGEVIVRIDSDSRISTTRGFQAMVPHLADPEVGGVQGFILPLQSSGWTRSLRFMEIAWNHLFLRRAQMATRTTQVVDGAFCAFRRADLLSIGGWVPWNGEDTEVTLRLQRLGFRMRFEPGAAAFEDVPEDYEGLRKQRIRWNRGGVFAHRRHLGGLFTDPLEFGGLAMVMWLTFFVRGGLRGLIWLYAIILAVVAGLPTILDILIISLTLLIPRGAIIAYYLIRMGRERDLPYILAWPALGTVKQLFAVEAFGTMLPGSIPEFAE